MSIEQILERLALIPSQELHPKVFRGTEVEDITEWLASFRRIALHNQWTEERKLLTFPLYLEGSALTKLSLFIKGLKPHLHDALKLKQPSDYQAAVAFAKLQDSIVSDSVISRLEAKLDALLNPPKQTVVAATYREHPNLNQHIGELQTKIDLLKQGNHHRPQDERFRPIGRNLRTSDGQVICNGCLRVGHTRRSCSDRTLPLSEKMHFQHIPSQPNRWNHDTRNSTSFCNTPSPNRQFRNNVPRNSPHTDSRVPALYTNTIELDPEEDPCSEIWGKVNGKPVIILTDTGAKCSVIDSSIYDSIKYKVAEPTPYCGRLETAKGT
nr:uncharacterized protein LOC124806239 [Hydra vulgaris]